MKIAKRILGIGAILFIFPVVLTLAKSGIVDGRLSLKAWKTLLFDCFIFYPMFWNSVIYSLLITLIQLVIVILGSFGLIMIRGRIKKVIIGLYIVLMMLPLQVTLLPNYIGLRGLHLLFTRTGIILPMVFSTFGMIVMYQYLSMIDTEQIEAARLETNSVVTIICKIIIPQVKVCIFAVALFIYEESYNMLEQPLLFLKEKTLQTLSVFVANASSESPEVLFPAAVIYMIPVVILYAFFGNSLRNGFLTGEKREKE